MPPKDEDHKAIDELMRLSPEEAGFYRGHDLEQELEELDKSTGNDPTRGELEEDHDNRISEILGDVDEVFGAGGEPVRGPEQVSALQEFGGNRERQEQEQQNRLASAVRDLLQEVSRIRDSLEQIESVITGG